MQYNSETNGQDMVTLADLLCGQNTTTFPIAEKTVYANMANRLILTEIFKSYGGWKYDDKNHTDFPISTTDLVADQQDYALPLELDALNGVYVQNENDTTWIKAIPTTLEQINEMQAEPEYQSTPATVFKYRVLGNSLKFYPPISYAKTGGLMIEFSRDISTFAVTDTTKTAGFDTIFHEAIPTYMAYQYAQRHLLNNKNELKEQWVDYISKIKKHYARKWRDSFPVKLRLADSLTNNI